MTPQTPSASGERPSRPRRERARVLRSGEFIGYLVLALLIVGTYQISQIGWYTSYSDTGYWMGVVGGVMMLLLFLYPMRKRWNMLANVGKAKNWFVVHMALGILGPVLVLAHSTFKVGSLNAGVALYSMLIVAASGIAGRFIYLRIHRGLGTELQNYKVVRTAVGFDEPAAHSQLNFAPRAEALLRHLDTRVGQPQDPLRLHLIRLFVLPIDAMKVRYRARQDVSHAIKHAARKGQWDDDTKRQRLKRGLKMVDEYVTATKRVAQFGAYTRLFALWHLAHVPFVFIMVLCAVFHVIAVHAY